ncbi:hypothetical protein GCM10018793_66290 [Streptomyces sulfonofaciens]|uniref:Lipoprotein n=1 Tax=Streptomyces sulfonofaciens TaxID=68272 RepID=A0A919GP60_9ACTN|nr:hypothetical protein [Streptomyces sulfonofaciens]GHH88071.1 hypothetical protein GCM10018793_66290 [Streptomyces sulfonofaciens]
MPFTLPPRAPGGPHRRTLLLGAPGLAAGAVLTAGCTGDDAARDAARERSATARARTGAARESAGLVAHYDAVLTAHPPLAPRLAPLRAEVVRHLAAFGGAAQAPSAGVSGAAGGAEATGDAGVPGGAEATGVPASEAVGDPRAAVAPAPPEAPGVIGAPAVPVGEAEALSALAAAERALADRRLGALAELPGEFARLLASVAAAGAVHAYLLTEGAG